MKKIVIIMLLALAACSQTQNDDDIREQISDYKEQVSELNKKIMKLEKELESNNMTPYQVPVRVKDLQYETFNHYFEVSGTIEAVNEAYISPEISGVIEKIYVEEGERVSKGQVLVKLTTEVTENTIEEVESSLEFAEVIYTKQKRLWDQGIGSEVQYLEAKNNRDAFLNKLETLKAQKRMAIINAPIDGLIDEIYRKEGELALPGVQLMQVVNLDQLYINADVSESYLPVVREGEMVRVTYPVYPELDMEAPVFRVGNVINPGNRTFKMQLKVKNPENKLKPNVLSVIRVNDFSTDSAIVVPSNIIKQDKKGQYLYVLADTTEIPAVKKVYVETGRSYGPETMILEGLSKNNKVVTEGYNQVTDGSPVEVRK